MKRVVSTSLIVTGLALFVLALVVTPQGVPESVWTGIATGFFTTGLIEWVLLAIRDRERREEMARRAGLIAPLDYYDPVVEDDPVVDLALSNNNGEVAIHVVVATRFPEGMGLLYTRAIERAIEWAPLASTRRFAFGTSPNSSTNSRGRADACRSSSSTFHPVLALGYYSGRSGPTTWSSKFQYESHGRFRATPYATGETSSSSLSQKAVLTDAPSKKCSWLVRSNSLDLPAWPIYRLCFDPSRRDQLLTLRAHAWVHGNGTQPRLS